MLYVRSVWARVRVWRNEAAVRLRAKRGDVNNILATTYISTAEIDAATFWYGEFFVYRRNEKMVPIGEICI